MRIILTSYADELARSFGRAVRNELARNPLCTTRLIEDSKAANRWNTPEGGGMLTAGRGGGILGFGGDLLIIDDPIKNWKEATSRTVREEFRDWFGSTLYNRREPGATIVLLMQRWTEDDPVGWLMDEQGDNWELIRLPALAEVDDVLGRKPGEALCPARYTTEDLENAREVTAPHIWEAQYQQRPTGFGPGRAYARFLHDRNVDAGVGLVDTWPLQLALDFNINPGMHGEIGQYDRDRDLFTSRYELFSPRLTVLGLVNKLAALLDGLGAKRPDDGGVRHWPWPDKLHVFGDATGSAERAGTGDSDYDVLKQALAAQGIPYRIRVPKSNPPIKNRLNAANMALRDVRDCVHWIIHPDCKRLVYDLGHVQLDDEGLIDKAEQALSHASDADGYRITYQRPVRSAERTTVDPGRFSVRA